MRRGLILCTQHRITVQRHGITAALPVPVSVQSRNKTTDASSSIHAADTAHALNIDQFSRQAIPFANVLAHSHESTMSLLLDAARVVPGSRVLDVACGPGLVSLAAAERGALVTGVDLTPACIEGTSRVLIQCPASGWSLHSALT